MADHYAYYNQNQITKRKINKVYINPNFNRSDNVPTSNISSSNMYFNPNFSHNATNSLNQHCVHDPKIQTSKARIHVNPNFLRNPNIVKVAITNNPIKPLTLPSASINNSILCKELDQEQRNQSQTPLAITKSRYCLVRQKENVITTSATKPITKTVKVNKYKSISLHVVKSNLATSKLASTINASSLRNKKFQSGKQIEAPNKNSKFKYIKPNAASILNQSQTKYVAVSRYTFLNKSSLKTPSRKINNRLSLKKNNIPCPLFKKYGKCLRKLRGTCEYLHDKKHVSICRTFLKGVCHDKDCLLSHDLTDKKMPTCYFYLQGACTKESCPYLHVKLSEKTKICQDFRSGYCEKGDKCQFRHINVCKEMASKKVSLMKQFTYSPASKINVGKVKSRKKSQVILSQENNPKYRLDLHTEAHRYFKESVEDNHLDEKCDMIKPSRIKLGTLPAFIQI